MMFNLKYVCILFMLLPFELFAQSQLGKTYPVVERSALDEINSKAQNFKGIENIDIQKTTAFKGHPLPFNTENKIRTIAPFYTLDFDIKDSEGKTLYPKGFTYNVAEYVKLPFRVIVFSEQHVEYVKSNKLPSDILLLTHGDIFKVKDDLDGNVFFLDERLADRFYVEGTPTIIKQVGARYEITEIYLEDK